MRGYMKVRDSKNYLVIGGIHYGYDAGVILALQTFAKQMDCEIIHTGALATKEEIAMYNRRLNKLHTWECQVEQKIESTSLKIESLRKSVKTKKDKKKILPKIKKLKEELQEWKLERKDKTYEGEVAQLENMQQDRVDALVDMADIVHFVCNDKLSLPVDLKLPSGSEYFDRNFQICKHLYITSTPANGDKVSHNPITGRTFKMLRKIGHSHIVPHPIPHTKVFPREGLNQAFNFLTTGGLKLDEYPDRISESFKSQAGAGGIFVAVDTENGEFHAQRLRVQKFEDNNSEMCYILYDGLAFTEMGEVFELDDTDRAVYTTDIHAPYEHPGVIAAARFLTRYYRPYYFIEGGDTSDYRSVCPHLKNKRLHSEGLRLVDDFKSLRRILDSLIDSDSVKAKVLIYSNHAHWVTRFVEEQPALHGTLDWETLAKTWFSDWDVRPLECGDKQSYRFGDIVIRHGNQESVSKASNVYIKYLGGHDHTFQEDGFATKTGPGCRLGPQYLEGNETGWQNQITTLTKWEGEGDKHPKTVLHDDDLQVSRFIYRGEIIEVPFYHVNN